MKEWILPIFFSALASLLLRLILPEGEKAPLYPPLKFLLSLMLTLSVLSPILSVAMKGESGISLPDLELQEEGGLEEAILEKSRRDMEEALRQAFPESAARIELEHNEAYIPTGIRVYCNKAETGQKMALFLRENFSLVTRVILEGESG